MGRPYTKRKTRELVSKRGPLIPEHDTYFHDRNREIRIAEEQYWPALLKDERFDTVERLMP